jgi:hypothetical protein
VIYRSIYQTLPGFLMIAFAIIMTVNSVCSCDFDTFHIRVTVASGGEITDYACWEVNSTGYNLMRICRVVKHIVLSKRLQNWFYIEKPKNKKSEGVGSFCRSLFSNSLAFG